MILFHGTIEGNIKKIKKDGLLDATQDQWLLEVIKNKVCCVSNHPTSGEGGNAAYFAYGHPKIKNQDGYLVVIDIPKSVFQDKLLAIFDNKILDDYVRFHFFVREEFRHIGRKLLLAMTEYRQQDRYFNKLDEKMTKRQGKENDRALFNPQDQRHYYKKIRDSEQRMMYRLLGLEFSDEFFEFINYIGRWRPFYQFLQLHFAAVQHEQMQNWQALDHAQYWQNFYRSFPLKIEQPKQQHWQNWFSPQWLSQKRTTELTENCQILMESIDKEYIKGAIKITTPSGFATPFRSCRAKGGFAKLIWKEVHKIIG